MSRPCAPRAIGRARPKSIIRKEEVVEGGASRWLLEGRLRRLRHRDDGLLPADVAAERHHRGAAQRPRRLFQPEQRAQPHLFRHRPAVRRPHRVRGWRDGLGSAARRRSRSASSRSSIDVEEDDDRMSSRSRGRIATIRRAARRIVGGRAGRRRCRSASPATTAPAGRGRCRVGAGGSLPRAGASRRRSAQRRPRPNCGRNSRSGKSRHSSRRRSRSARRCAAIRQLANSRSQLAIDMTPEGLRIQILDADREPMFAVRLSGPERPCAAAAAEGCAGADAADAGHLDRRPYRRGAVRRRRPDQLGTVRRTRQCHAAAADRWGPAGDAHPQCHRQCRARSAASGRPVGRRQPSHRHRRAAVGATIARRSTAASTQTTTHAAAR